MKHLPFLFLFITFTTTAQSEIQFVKVKQVDRSIKISVINHTLETYTILIDAELENMKAAMPFPTKMVLKPREKNEITTLIPISDDLPTRYLLNYKIIDQEISSFIYEPNITIYTENRSKRSTQLLIYLNQNGIAYNEINTSFNGDTKDIYQSMLERRGIDKKSAKIPVVIYNGSVFHDIKNVKDFCQNHLADEGRFIRKQDRKY